MSVPANHGPYVGIHAVPRTGPTPGADSGAANRGVRSGYLPLRPWHIRNRRFAVRWRGLDPVEVHGFLNRAANDLAAVYAELAASREETQRIKDALRRWQSSQAPSAYELAGGR